MDRKPLRGLACKHGLWVGVMRFAARASTFGPFFAIGAALIACTETRPETPNSSPRVVSLTPVVTETLLALEATDALVAVSDFCPRDAAVAGLPRVGTSLVPQLEPIARLEPSLILTEHTSGVDLRLLGRIASVRAWPWRTLADAIKAIEGVGKAAGAPARASALAARFERALQPRRPLSRASVLGVLGYGAPRPGEIWYVRSDSLHGSAFRAAGLRLVPSEAPSGPPRMSYEALIALDPGAIVILAKDARSATAAATSFTALSPLGAPRAGRVFSISTPEVFSTGPPLLDLVTALLDNVATRLEPRL